MIVIYHDFGGTHSTATAAAVHLGIVDGNGPAPDRSVFETGIPYFDHVSNSVPGKILYAGRDELGNDVYIMGRRREIDLSMNAIISTAQIFGHSADEFMFIDVMPCVNTLMRIGGFLSRRLGLISIGRPVVIRGAQAAFPRIAQLVETTKVKLIGVNAPEATE